MSRRARFALLAVVVVSLLTALLLEVRRRANHEAQPDPNPRTSTAAGPSLVDGDDPALDGLGPSARFAGRVLDQDDLGVPGAQVCVVPAAGMSLAELSFRPRCTTADDDGWFAIAVAPGLHRLHGSARGFIPPPIADGRPGLLARVAAGQTRDGLQVRLRQGGAEVRGIVFDINGGAIEAAEVFSEGAWTRTDPEGQFSLWLDVRSYVRLSVRAEGYAHASMLEWRPIGRVLEIRLRPEVVLTGRVLHADTDEPVADVAVLVHPPAMFGFGASSSTQPQVRTDPDGRFRFPGLSPGRYKPEVRSGSFRGVAAASVLLTLGVEPKEVVIRVHPARQLGGRVVDARTDEPCEVGTIVLYDAAGARVEAGIAEADGEIQVGGLLPGPYTVEAQCDQSSPSTHELVDLSETDVLDAVWVVERPSGRAIRGRVVDGSGNAVAMASLLVELREPEDPDGHIAVAQAVTPRDGSFELLDLPPGRYSFTRVQAEGFGDPTEQPELVLPRDRDVDGFEIVLPDPGALRVRIRDESGEPVPDYGILVGKNLGGTAYKSTPDSEWLVDPLSPGSYHIKALRPGIGNRAGPDDPSRAQFGEPVEVVAGETAELTLTVPSRNEVIAGIVETNDGDPIADASVRALSSESFIDWGGREVHPAVVEAITDTDGRFVLEHLEHGTYAVHVESQASVKQVREGVESGTKNLRFGLPSPGSLRGRVSVAGGDPPQRFSISVKLAGEPRGRSEAFLFTSGTWEVVGLPPGAATVEVSAAEGTASASVTIPEGDELSGIALELAARGRLRGRVVDATTHAPVPGLYVTASSSAGAGGAALDPEGKHHTDDDGRFDLEQVPSGELTVHLWSFASTSVYGNVEVRVSVEAGGTTDAGTIEISAKSADDAPTYP